MTPKDALETAIRVLGSQTAVAAAAGEDVRTGHIFYWLTKASEVPPRYCPGIEQATREKGEVVYCEHLCPGTDWSLIRDSAGPTGVIVVPPVTTLAKIALVRGIGSVEAGE